MGVVSSQNCLSISGSPHGCVMAPFLIIPHTNGCGSKYNDSNFLKFTNNTVLLVDKEAHGQILKKL